MEGGADVETTGNGGGDPCLLALVVSMIVPAAADNGGDRVTLRLAEKAADDEQFETDIDVGEEGKSIGDYTVFESEPIFNRALTRQVGVFQGDCLAVSIVPRESATAECDFTVVLDKGLITVEGPITFSEQSFDDVQEWAVTGGTGAYKSAHGELELDFSDGAGVRLTFRLIL
jgi:hypothetical protein